MVRKHPMVWLCVLALWSACSKPVVTTELARYPIASLEGVLSRTDVIFDQNRSVDGNGSLRIDAREPTVVRLFETGDLDVEHARIMYRAKVRTEEVKGTVYLELWCHFPGRGEYFSRGLDSPLSGTTDWVTQEISFFLKRGENPDNIKLNLVIDGTGTVWIDDIHLTRGPLA